ncbi:MAG TPA: choice-of-anchor G family protein, partial [Jatrophihabitans sp.]|nr:choice-of-anchor G family protein [Jatrophihabitans sp.]
MTAVASSGGGAAGAATLPQAQSVGNFLDATLGGNTLDQVAALEYATAKSPGTQSVQNPLNATVLNAVTLPLTGTLQLPELLGINLGAVNQVAVAEASGHSYGASGAVNNSGGVSVGGNNAAFPADATIDLTANGIAGNSPIPIPGGTGSADALGGVQAKIGAVHALAQ